MAYQDVKSCRFYVDWNSYIQHLGLITGEATVRVGETDGQGSYLPLGQLNPTYQRFIKSNTAGLGASETGIIFETANGIGKLDLNEVNWSGVIGHKLGSLYNYTAGVAFRKDPSGANNTTYPKLNLTEPIVNCYVENELMGANYNGFSICKANGTTETVQPYEITGIYSLYRNVQSTAHLLKMGSYCFGEYYDMPHSPDMSLALSYEYDGINTQETLGGATISNAMYTKPADFGENGAWQLPIYGERNYRTGRRKWDLSFSYLADTDVFPVNAATDLAYASTYSTTQMMDDFGYSGNDIYSNGSFKTNLHNGKDFFSVVWNRTVAGHLPFIFQPDSTNPLPDQFALCRFDMDTLRYEQIANRLYKVQVSIRESW